MGGMPAGVRSTPGSTVSLLCCLSMGWAWWWWESSDAVTDPAGTSTPVVWLDRCVGCRAGNSVGACCDPTAAEGGVLCGMLCLRRDLIAEHDKRAQNHAELLECLRGVNKMIQRAGRLHVGPPQSRVVAACRAAVKANNVQAITRIVQQGA